MGAETVRVVAELIAARIQGDAVRFAIRTAACPRAADPDATARAELATLFPSLWLRTAVVHSTSWRYEDESLILTYVGYGEDLEISRLPLSFALSRAREIDGGPAAVAAHAIRHLALLVAEDPRPFAKRLRPETLTALATVAPAPSGRLPLRAA